MSSFAATGPLCVTFRTSLACSLKDVSTARLKVRNFLEEQRVREEEISACELALAEACNNAVQNATPRGRNQPVEIVVICTPSQVELHVNDHTPGFDWPEDAKMPDWQDEHGRGLFFIQSFMDRASYSPSRSGNRLVMGKARASGSAPDATTALRVRVAENQQALSEMARELCFRSETLAAICRCSADLGRSNDLKGFAERLLNDLLHIAAADWFVVRTLQSNQQLSTFACSLETACVEIEYSDTTAETASVEAESARLRSDIAFGPGCLGPGDPLSRMFPQGSGFVHPIRMDQTLIGTLAIGKNATGTFSVAQREVIRTFADFLAIQILNGRLREEQISARLLSHELDIAREIQLSLLPRRLPFLSGFGLAAFCQSARQVGGDFYDVQQVSPSSVLLVIADVMGKGVPAAMFAAQFRSLIRANPESVLRPGQLLARINELLFEDLSAVHMFITAQLVLLDLEKRSIVIGSAGHCPLLLAGTADNEVCEISADGMPLGVLREAIFVENTITFPAKARLLLYTDGVTEGRNAEGEAFGVERLQRWFADQVCSAKTSEELKQDLVAQLAEFEAKATLQDDRTFLVAAEE